MREHGAAEPALASTLTHGRAPTVAVALPMPCPTLARALLAALVAALTLLSAVFAPGTDALAHAPGGTRAPSAPRSGGVEYGVATLSSTPRPEIARLSVPRSARAGAPPAVVLRIEEPGVGTVYVRAAITSLRTRAAVVVTTLGWVHTGRDVVVRWPAHSHLSPGTYHVSVTARDHHGGTLLRRAHASGVAALTVTAVTPPAAPPVPPAPVPSPPLEVGVPTPAQTVADGAVFPVGGPHSYGDPFGAPRAGGRIHQGQDVLAAEGTPVLAPLGGVISSTSYQAGGAGYYLVEHTTVGFDFMFAHCVKESFTVAAMQTVGAGQQLCSVGQTGDATGSHLHFEMWVGGWQAAGGHPIDPLPYLQAWERR
jgi:hypothetical protein